MTVLCLDFAAAATAFFLVAASVTQLSAQPDLSPEAYAVWSGGTLIPAGRTEIDERPMTCGAYPTVLDGGYKDFGAAYPGFLVLNPRFFVGLATPVKLWIFSHECAHQTVGADEVKADCAAVRRGRREGWLSADGLAQVCEFMKPARADSVHFSGPHRCELMHLCFRAIETQRPAKSGADVR
jgi:hypothetical protein